jgi:CheY-like chemotaxis protein
MPIMDGYEATKRLTELMEQKTIPKIPIIGLTAFTSIENK